MPLIYGEGEDNAFRRLRKEIEGELPDSEYEKLTHILKQMHQRSLEKREEDRRSISPARKIEILKTLHTSPYRDRKDRNPERVPGTCEWFVTHELFQSGEKASRHVCSGCPQILGAGSLS